MLDREVLKLYVVYTRIHDVANQRSLSFIHEPKGRQIGGEWVAGVKDGDTVGLVASSTSNGVGGNSNDPSGTAEVKMIRFE